MPKKSAFASAGGPLSWLSGFLTRRIRDPILTQLRGGIPVATVSRAVVLGIISAGWPQIGTNTIMAWILARIFGCSRVVAGGVSLVASPLQYMLMIPLLRLGEWLLGLPHFRITLGEILTIVVTDPLGSFKVLGLPLLYAIVGWVVVSICVYVPLYWMIRGVVRRMAGSRGIVSGLQRKGRMHDGRR